MICKNNVHLQFLYISAMELPQLNAKFIIRNRRCPVTEVKRRAACIYTPSSSVNLSSYFISPEIIERRQYAHVLCRIQLSYSKFFTGG